MTWLEDTVSNPKACKEDANVCLPICTLACLSSLGGSVNFASATPPSVQGGRWQWSDAWGGVWRPSCLEVQSQYEPRGVNS